MSTVAARFSLEDLHRMAVRRPPGYLDAVLKLGTVQNNQVTLALSDYQLLRAKFANNEPASEWPDWAVELAKKSARGDRGVGDTIRRLVGVERRPAFKVWHQATFGLWIAPCGPGLLKRWNQLYPYASRR